MEKNLRFFSYGIIALLVIMLGMWFVLAAASAPTAVHFENNVTSVYDEGNFSVNWTAGSADVVNYTIYLFADNVLYTTADNDSETGYSFSNSTEANYTFIIEAVNSTNNNANSSNVSMYVDASSPVAALGTNPIASYNSSSANVVFDLKCSDNSGVSQIKLYGNWSSGWHANYTNASYTNNTWLNTTVSGISEGYYVWGVYCNDTTSDTDWSTNRTLRVDTTDPAASASCSPSSVTTGSSFPCTCSGSDTSGSGVSTSSGSSTSGSITSTSSTGTFTYTCTVTDNAGNSASTTATYTVEQTPSSGSTTTTTWTTHTITEGVFEQGYTRELEVKNRLKVQINDEDHYIGVVSISGEEATIEISSVPVQVTLSATEEAKIDVTDDGFYDVYVLLNGITNNKADVTIQKIHEEVPEDGTGVETTGETEEEPAAEEETDLTWLWILVGLVIIVLIGLGIGKRKK